MRILHYLAVLAVVCAISALGVAGTYAITRERIQGRERQERLKAQSEVVPAPPDSAPEFVTINPDTDALNQVIKAQGPDGNVLGYVALGEAQGYGGKIKVMVGMNADATTIIGLTIVPPLNETPGLGTRVAEIKSNKTWFSILAGQAPEGEEETVPAFLKQFLGLQPEQVVLGGAGKGIQALTGATVSSRGVTNAVRNATGKIRAVVGAMSDPEGTTGATAWQE